MIGKNLLLTVSEWTLTMRLTTKLGNYKGTWKYYGRSIKCVWPDNDLVTRMWVFYRNLTDIIIFVTRLRTDTYTYSWLNCTLLWSIPDNRFLKTEFTEHLKRKHNLNTSDLKRFKLRTLRDLRTEIRANTGGHVNEFSHALLQWQDVSNFRFGHWTRSRVWKVGLYICVFGWFYNVCC